MIGLSFGMLLRCICDINPHGPARFASNAYGGMSRPQFRLRVGEIRVFYDVAEKTVEVLAIVPKSIAAECLEMAGSKS